MFDKCDTGGIVIYMTYTQLNKIHTENRNAAWKRAYNVALARFMDEGYDLATASTMADDQLFQINWILANSEG